MKTGLWVTSGVAHTFPVKLQEILYLDTNPGLKEPLIVWIVLISFLPGIYLLILAKKKEMNAYTSDLLTYQSDRMVPSMLQIGMIRDLGGTPPAMNPPRVQFTVLLQRVLKPLYRLSIYSLLMAKYKLS